MNIPMGDAFQKAVFRRRDRVHAGHAQYRRRSMSRRQFVRTAAGAAAVGATLGTGLWRPGVARADGSFQPIPIPGGTPALGGGFHVFAPGLIDPSDAEPITITDFNGFIGLAYLSGTVVQTNTATGEILTLPFVESDMRFMKGVFQGTDGQIHKGTFALV
jgi:hypothetical protein